MNNKEFEKLLERRINLIKSVMSSKNKEYATDDDKFHNFKRAGDMLRQTPEQALIGMWTKHIISILDIVKKIDDDASKELINVCDGTGLSLKMLEEKIGDAINYLILLEAMIKERYEW